MIECLFLVTDAGVSLVSYNFLFDLEHLTLFICASVDGNVLQFEDGYIVETVVQGNELGIMPYRIRVSQEGELFAVDADKNNIVRITPPLSQCKYFSFSYFLDDSELITLAYLILWLL